MERKKVIFVLSTSWAGSTFLDLMLGNGSDCFSCGELINLFRNKGRIVCSTCYGPPRSKTEPSGPHPIYCDIWKKVYENGRKRIYDTLFSLFPNVNVIVESSKSDLWFREQKRNIEDRFEVHTVVIYKHPLNFAYSGMQKYPNVRDCDWMWEWRECNSKFFPHDPIFVSYKDLCENPSGTLRKLCDKLDIEYFDGKELFWNRESHHMINGSWTAKIHLYTKDSDLFNECLHSLERIHGDKAEYRVNAYRTISYYTKWESVPELQKLLTKQALDLFNELEKRKI